MTRETPSSARPYSMLPLTKTPAPPITLPATRTTKRSPTPWSKSISGGTRESAQPTITAMGCWPSARGRKSSGPRRGLTGAPFTNRSLPSRSRRSTSSGGGPAPPGPAACAAGRRARTSPAARAVRRSTSRRVKPAPRSDMSVEAADLANAEHAGRLAILGGRDPQDGAVASLARVHGIDGDDIDPLRRELAEQPLSRPHAIGARNQEGALGAGDLPLGLLGHLAECRRIRRHEIHLRVSPMRKAGEGDQVDSRFMEHGERPRPLSRAVGHHHLEVGHALHAIRHERLLLEVFRRSLMAGNARRRPLVSSAVGETWIGRGERI